MVVEDRVLPYSLDAEKAVLGSILLTPAAWALAASVIDARDFFRIAHQRIFQAFGVLAERGVSPDFVTLKAELVRTGELDECGGPAYLTSLTDGLPVGLNVEAHAGIVKEQARLRNVIFEANKLLAAAYEAGTPSGELVESGVRGLLASAAVRTATVRTVGDEAVDFVMGLDTPPTDAMPTGYADLDEILAGGIRRDELTVLAGRPSSGKSSLGLGMALGLARAGHPTVFFSLEMRSQALASRLVSWESRVGHDRLTRRLLSESDFQKLSKVAGLQDVPLYLQDTVATLTEVTAWCERLRGQHGIKAAVIDYLQLLVPERRHQDRQVEVAGISRGLKRLAATQGIAVLALAQLNRAPEGRRDNRPRLGDLRESGALETDADVGLLLFRPEQYDQSTENEGVAEVIVAKNRQGATGTVKLAFLAQMGGLFESLEWRSQS